MSSAPLPPSPFTDLLARAGAFAAASLRYWEPRRLVFNGVLALVVLGHVVAAWPGVQSRLTFDLALGLFLLAVLANLCYCSVYGADLFLQIAGLPDVLRVGRALLLGVGTAFAAALAHLVAHLLFGV